MTWRRVAAAALGFTLWWFLFFAVGIAIGALWPAYREAGRSMYQEGDLSLFVTPMLFANLLVFVVAGAAVGSVTTLVGKSRIPARLVAAVLFIYAAINHYLWEWDQLTPWYNVIVPFVVAGSILLGSRLPAGHRGTGAVEPAR